MRTWATLLGLLLECAARAATPPPPAERPETGAVAPARAAPPDEVMSVLAKLSLEQKVGQLMMIGVEGRTLHPSSAAQVRGFQVGGVLLYRRNLANAGQTARLIDELRALLADAVPPFIAVDQEGGPVVRLEDGLLVLPGNMALGAARSPELAFEAGRAQAEDLRRLGFNMNLAPVLDVNLNPRNPVIGARAFSDDVNLVARLGVEFIRGQQQAGIVTLAKHFPGHGSTDEDSHDVLPIVRDDAATFREQLAPFQAAIAAELDGVLTAHVAVPSVTGNQVPASMSPELLSTLLRDELDFEGLVLTDGLEMKSVLDHYEVGEAAVAAVRAGSDMVLISSTSEQKQRVYDALLEAARDGRLTRSRIDASVRRVLAAKLRRGVFQPLLPWQQRRAGLGAERALAVDLSRKSVTLLRTSPRTFPLQPRQRVGVVSHTPSLGEAILRRDADAIILPFFPPSDHPFAQHLAKAYVRRVVEASDVLVVGVARPPDLEWVRQALKSGKPVVVVLAGLPYAADQLGKASTLVLVYSDLPEAMEAAVGALYAEHDAPGRLPIQLRGFPFGHGFNAATGAEGLAGAGSPQTPRERPEGL